ncbi:uncharacterized protein involved in tellurium resistance [Streptomyces sp. W4I9-2]|nr:uncharacterized protein involved in tellurium resistance [Streptomyces sp. W4I9-2]
MGFFDGLWPGRAAQFDSGNSTSSAIVLSKRNATISLSKQGALSGNLRVNLSWRMRTSDIEGRSRQSGRLRRPLQLFKPEVVQAHTQGVVNVDLDLGCMYELMDGTKGVVQPLGSLIGDLNGPPYVRLSGDDRFGAPSGETVYVNLDQRDQIKRLLFFVYISTTGRPRSTVRTPRSRSTRATARASRSSWTSAHRRPAPARCSPWRTSRTS